MTFGLNPPVRYVNICPLISGGRLSVNPVVSQEYASGFYIVQGNM